MNIKIKTLGKFYAKNTRIKTTDERVPRYFHITRGIVQNMRFLCSLLNHKHPISTYGCSLLFVGVLVSARRFHRSAMTYLKHSTNKQANALQS